MPRRYLGDDISRSATINRFDANEERTYWRLHPGTDDFGRFDARPEVLKADCYPLKEEITATQCVLWVLSLALKGALKLYEDDGKLFGYFPAWTKHQFCRAKTSRFPDPTEANTLTREQMITRVNICLRLQSDANIRLQTQSEGAASTAGDKPLTDKVEGKNLMSDANKCLRVKTNRTYTYTNTFTDYLSIISSTDKARADFIFGSGLDLLIAQGASEANARKHLGSVLSRYGSSTACCAVWQALQDGVGDARSYIVGVAKRIKAQGDNHGGFSERDYNRDATPDGEIAWLKGGEAALP